MPGVTAALSKTVVFIFSEDGQNALGTGFLVGNPVPGRPGRFVPLIVTARHVVGDRDVIMARFSLSSGGSTGFVKYNLAAQRVSNDCWVHPDPGVDVLIFRTAHFEHIDYQQVPVDMIATKAAFTEDDIKPSDRVIFPSMLSHFMGTTRNFPVTRDGTIALVADELIPLTFDIGATKITTQQELILLDATSIPGASGSPIFLWPGPRIVRNAFNMGGGKPWLIGVMHGFYGSAREILKINTTDAARVIEMFAENSRIAIVFPSWRIHDILESTALVQRMAEIATSIPTDAPPIPDAVTPSQ